VLEVASGEHGDCTDTLVKTSENGLNELWRNNQRNTLQLQSLNHIDRLMESGRITPVKAPPILFSRMTNGNQLKEDPTFCWHSQYPTSFCNQIYVLLKRTFLLNSRDRTLTYSRLTTHFGIALFIGVLYHGIGEDASNILNNFNFLFFTVMFLMLTAFNCVTTTFPSELPIITREHFNKWYSLKSYYLAITLADIPIQIVATLIYAIVTYFLTMQPVEAYRIFSFMFMCILISLVAQSFGLFIGAMMDIKVVHLPCYETHSRTLIFPERRDFWTILLPTLHNIFRVFCTTKRLSSLHEMVVSHIVLKIRSRRARLVSSRI
jgi:ATP-binding cassette subfamily G (WHITE) protein 1